MRLTCKILKNIKNGIILFLVFEFLIAGVLPASAFPSASSIAAELEQRYHLNLKSIQNQGENFNVSDQKKLSPEMSLFFNPSDPKEGQKISAKAFPVYFSNPEESLYYTWYLKRKGCERNNSPSQAKKDLCDADKDGKITIEDWKVTSARIIAQGGYESGIAVPKPDYVADGDANKDAYLSKFGGDHKENTPDYCYVHDNYVLGSQSTLNYELVEGSNTTTFNTASGPCPIEDVVCMVTEEDDATKCSVSGLPYCNADGTPACLSGTPYCVSNPVTVTLCSEGTALTTCSTTTQKSANPICRHLFPNAKGKLSDGTSVDFESGDGNFKGKEEQFWSTDPADPDTADNSNKDEANVVGLGQQTFTWNYMAGDLVGVIVEGASMVNTKHDDASFMTMWAFSKNDCPVPASAKGSYTKTIKGYPVEIPTAALDLNDCVERNLVNPTQGGQATKLEVNVSAIPENPVNDETPDKAGDVVITEASVSNAQRELTDTYFEWSVQIGKDFSFSPETSKDITKILQDNDLLGNNKGNALDSISVKLDMSSKLGSFFNQYVKDGVGYLRFKVKVKENFVSGATRQGNSDVIVKFTSSQKKIAAYLAQPDKSQLSGSVPKMKVALPALTDVICNDDALDRAACRVIGNEIIGLRIDPTGLSNFHWTINGAPYLCSYKYVSKDCADPNDTQQNNVIFFPVTGNVGDTYTVVVTANDTGDGVENGNILTLTRTFHIVDPLVEIESADTGAAWPKLLGQYKDITGQATECPGGWCDDYSKIIFQALSGSQLKFKAKFIPSFLKNISEREWRVDGEIVTESAPGEISFTANKFANEIYNVGLLAQVFQSEDLRRALKDIWNVSPFESTEINLESDIQVELKDASIVKGPFQNERKYLAALISYIPASLLFTLRIVLSAALTLFAASFLHALLRERNKEVS